MQYNSIPLLPLAPGFPLPVVVISLIARLGQPNLTYYRQYSTPQDPTTCSISTYTAYVDASMTMSTIC